jgi:hypothetical protein
MARCGRPRAPLRLAFEGRADLGGAGLGVSTNDPELPSSLTRELTKFRQLTVHLRSSLCAWLKAASDIRSPSGMPRNCGVQSLVYGFPSDE